MDESGKGGKADDSATQGGTRRREGVGDGEQSIQDPPAPAGTTSPSAPTDSNLHQISIADLNAAFNTFSQAVASTAPTSVGRQGATDTPSIEDLEEKMRILARNLEKKKGTGVAKTNPGGVVTTTSTASAPAAVAGAEGGDGHGIPPPPELIVVTTSEPTFPRPREPPPDDETIKMLRLKHQNGPANEFDIILKHYYPLASERKAVYKKITGEEKASLVPEHHPPAGGHGALFYPQHEQFQLFDPSSKFSLDRAIQTGFVNTRTGAPAGDLRYLAAMRETDSEAGSIPLNPEDGGISFMFGNMRQIFDINRDIPMEARMAEVQTVFSEKNCENLIRGISRAQADHYEGSHSAADTIPCPVLLDVNNSKGNLDGSTLRTVEAVFHRKTFNGEPDGDIRSEDFFRKMYSFLHHRYHSTAAYLIMSVICVGEASKHIRRCEGMNLGFLYMWESMCKLYMSQTNPDAADRALVDMRAKRPRNVAKFLRKLWQYSKEAAYSKPPEMRPSA